MKHLVGGLIVQLTNVQMLVRLSDARLGLTGSPGGYLNLFSWAVHLICIMEGLDGSKGASFISPRLTITQGGPHLYPHRD